MKGREVRLTEVWSTLPIADVTVIADVTESKLTTNRGLNVS